MDPITAFVAALAAGAATAAKGIASDAVQSLYKGLKGLLVGRLASLATIEEDPGDEDYLAAARKEVAKKGLADDPALLEQADRLTEALDREGPERLAAWGIDINEIRAARGVVIKNLEAIGGAIRITRVTAEEDIEISGVRNVISAKNC
jgi:hypothetical protein